MCRAAIDLDAADQIPLESFDLLPAAAAAEPLQILPALDPGHLLGSKLTEHLPGNIFHRRGTAACLAREILFFQNFTRGIPIGTILIKAITDLRMEKTMGRDLYEIPAVTAAQPDHLAVEALRRFLNGHQMTETLILNILDLPASILDLLVSDYSRHTTKNNPLLPCLSGFLTQYTPILALDLILSRQKFMTENHSSSKAPV